MKALCYCFLYPDRSSKPIQSCYCFYPKLQAAERFEIHFDGMSIPISIKELIDWSNGAEEKNSELEEGKLCKVKIVGNTEYDLLAEAL